MVQDPAVVGPNFFEYNKELNIPSVALEKEHVEILNELKEKVESLKVDEDTINFLDEPCLLRYLRANRFNLESTYAGIVSSLTWRKEFQPRSMKPIEFYDEGKTGKTYASGFDLDNRPVLYMNPSQQNTQDSRMHIRFTVFSLETCLRMMPPNVEKLTLIIDLRNYALKHTVPMNEAKEVLTILTTHYPERLGRAFVLEAPWIFSGFFKLVSPLLDPVTRDKIRFTTLKNKDENSLNNFIAKDNLPKDFGGESDFKFEPEAYLEQLNVLFQ